MNINEGIINKMKEYRKMKEVYQQICYISAAKIQGSFRKFVAWYFISVTDLQTRSCLVSFKELSFLNVMA